MEKQQYIYAVGSLSKHANPAHFQVLLGQLDDELPGHSLNPAVAETLAMPESKRGWRQAIINTRTSLVGCLHEREVNHDSRKPQNH